MLPRRKHGERSTCDEKARLASLWVFRSVYCEKSVEESIHHKGEGCDVEQHTRAIETTDIRTPPPVSLGSSYVY